MSNPTAAAHEALALAWVCIRAACLSLEQAQRAPQADQDEAYALAHHDLAEALSALDDAGRAVAAADPLGCVDTSPAHEALTLARSAYHTALAALGVDPLTLAA